MNTNRHEFENAIACGVNRPFGKLPNGTGWVAAATASPGSFELVFIRVYSWLNTARELVSPRHRNRRASECALQGLTQKPCGFLLTNSGTRIFCVFRDKRSGSKSGAEFFRAQGRADLGQIIDEDRALLCTGVKTIDL